MGQAVVDAPDPLQNPKPATPPSADDMLSQLAGDEIDRLLAEAEGQKSVKEAAPAPVAAAPAVESVGFDNKQSAAEIDALLAQAESNAPPATPPAEPPAAAAPVVVAAPVAVVKAPKSEPVPADVEIAKEIEQSEAERKALRAPEVKADTSPELIIDQTARLPLILKPLELLSSPLDACPDIVREAVGKIAIVTMVNAVAVLSYVLIFRRHH